MMSEKCLIPLVQLQIPILYHPQIIISKHLHNNITQGLKNVGWVRPRLYNLVTIRDLLAGNSHKALILAMPSGPRDP